MPDDDRLVIAARSCFDGERLVDEPRRILAAGGRIEAVLRPGEPLPAAYERCPVQAHAFVLPGLVEAHAHLFLDGGELDLERRKAHLRQDREGLMATGRANLERSLAVGITLVRDAGDKHGVNHAMRAHSRRVGGLPQVRSAGFALRKRGRYGSFMALEIDGPEDIAPLVARIAESADDCKILLTGIIDFAAAAVKGDPQFSADELQAIVAAARDHGLETYAHCSGEAGLQLAVDAGVGSIEHGFFMEERFLERMAAQGQCWCPTWSPVDFQRRRPELMGWDAASVAGLGRILDQHLDQIARADAMGLRLVAGSDAGSYGVVHGAALIDELRCFQQAGLSLARVLATATSTPRRAWGAPGGRLAAGEPADIACYAAHPRSGLAVMERAEAVVVAGRLQALTTVSG